MARTFPPFTGAIHHLHLPETMRPRWVSATMLKQVVHQTRHQPFFYSGTLRDAQPSFSEVHKRVESRVYNHTEF